MQFETSDGMIQTGTARYDTSVEHWLGVLILFIFTSVSHPSSNLWTIASRPPCVYLLFRHNYLYQQILNNPKHTSHSADPQLNSRPTQTMRAFISSPLPLKSAGVCRHQASVCMQTAPLPDVSVDAESAYNDGPFAKAGIEIFRRLMRPDIGWQSPRSGYDGLIEECRMLMARKGPEEQHRVVAKSLNAMFVSPHGPQFFRKHFSDKPEMNAKITPLVFSWLVGPCETNRPEEGGYGVLIEKCRFLEESGCKGMCVNMCQQPTQKYFTSTLGLPVRMTPNYDDMSCQMTFGVPPLPPHEDEALSGECLENCKMADLVKQQKRRFCYVSEAS